MRTTPLARRKLWTNVLHGVDVAILLVVSVLVFAFDKPGWLILLVLPTMFAALYFQHRLLKAEAAASSAPGGGSR